MIHFTYQSPPKILFEDVILMAAFLRRVLSKINDRAPMKISHA